MKSFEGKWRTSAVPDEPLDARPVIALDANRGVYAEPIAFEALKGHRLARAGLLTVAPDPKANPREFLLRNGGGRNWMGFSPPTTGGT
jgi:hypothetical protein